MNGYKISSGKKWFLNPSTLFKSSTSFAISHMGLVKRTLAFGKKSLPLQGGMGYSSTKKSLQWVFMVSAAWLVLMMGTLNAEEPLHILFIGNSSTFVHHMPQEIFNQVVVSMGHPAPVLQCSNKSNSSLQTHLNAPGTLLKIDAGGWDVVVLQESMQAASRNEERKLCLDAAVRLYDRIKSKSPNARVVFFETWPRQDAMWKMKPDDVKGCGRNSTEMQERIRALTRCVTTQEIPNHSRATRKGDASVAPVDYAWELNYKSASPLSLYMKDAHHPTPMGSYLAALIIYATIYHPENLKVPWHPETIKEAEAETLQHLAEHAYAK